MPVWRTLAQGTPKVSPGTIDNISQIAHVYRLNLNYNKFAKTLTFYGEVKSAKKISAYTVIIMFKGVTETLGLTEEEIFQGYQPKPSLGKNDILVRCSCPSYRFRFDKANRLARAGTGARFGIYHRKTDRKPNNPYDIPGACKHIFEFISYLQQQGFIH